MAHEDAHVLLRAQVSCECLYGVTVLWTLQPSQAAPAPSALLLLACWLRDRRRLGPQMQLLRAVSICGMSEAGACLW